MHVMLLAVEQFKFWSWHDCEITKEAPWSQPQRRHRTIGGSTKIIVFHELSRCTAPAELSGAVYMLLRSVHIQSHRNCKLRHSAGTASRDEQIVESEV